MLDAFVFDCPECGRPCEVAADAAGSVGDCPHCGREITIPAAAVKVKVCKPAGQSSSILSFGSVAFVVIAVLIAVFVGMVNQGGSPGAAPRQHAAPRQPASQIQTEMGLVTGDAEISHVTFDSDNVMQIHFLKPQSKQEYLLVAAANAQKFSTLRNGLSACVECVYNGGIRARVWARHGQVTDRE